jgi:hypothetical protein
MIRRLLLVALVLALAPRAARASEPDDTAKVQEKYKGTVEKGLKWLVERQEKDGHWEAPGGRFSIAVTASAGLALLSEGSTTRQGKYQDQLRKALDWTLAQAQKDGRLRDPHDPGERGRYMMSHGCAMLFLSQVYATETDEQRHKELGRVLERAVEFAQRAQTSRGGWGYVAAKECGDFDEGCATDIVLHGLFAARKAGVAVPKELVASSLAYLKKSSNVVKKEDDARKTQAGVLYTLALGPAGGGSPSLTTARLALLLNAGEEKNDLTVQWLNFVQAAVPAKQIDVRRTRLDEYFLFYFAQAVYQLGEDGHAKLRPDLAGAEKAAKETEALLKWSRVRAALYDAITAAQQEDGQWEANLAGEVYSTAVYLVVLQLDKGNLPYYKR